MNISHASANDHSLIVYGPWVDSSKLKGDLTLLRNLSLFVLVVNQKLRRKHEEPPFESSHKINVFLYEALLNALNICYFSINWHCLGTP